MAVKCPRSSATVAPSRVIRIGVQAYHQVSRGPGDNVTALGKHFTHQVEGLVVGSRVAGSESDSPLVAVLLGCRRFSRIDGRGSNLPVGLQDCYPAIRG